MNILNFLDKKAIFLETKAKNKDEFLIEISSLLAKNGFVKDANRFYEALKYREEQMTTSLNDGIAVPHGLSSTVTKPVVAISVIQNGID